MRRFLCLSCLDSTSRRRTYITISDDSDDELATLRPNVPVVVKDEDDDEDEVSILEVAKTAVFECISLHRCVWCWLIIKVVMVVVLAVE